MQLVWPDDGRYFESYWLLHVLWQKFRPLYHPTDIWTKENNSTEGTEANLVGQAGDNTFSLSVDA